MEEYDVIMVNHWECPVDNGAPILTMPNIPHALHGEGLQPRTVLGRTTWDHMRKACYANADFKSEISGEVPPKGQLHAHELFSYDYDKQEGIFQRCIALTKLEHDFIHSGRLLTLYARNNPLYPKSYVLKVIENGFNIIDTYNQEHPDQKPLRCFATFLDALKNPTIAFEVAELIEKYHIKFYNANIPRSKRWKGWHVIIGNKRYNSPYTNQDDWEVAMRKRNEEEEARNLKDPFSGKGAAAIDALLKIREETKIAGCKNGRLSKRKKEQKNELQEL